MIEWRSQLLSRFRPYKDHKHQFGIEAKLETIRLTKGEFNEWIVNSDNSRWPHTFIGIGTDGIALCSWQDFRAAYISSIQEKDPSWKPVTINKGYGPMKSVNIILSKLSSDKCHLVGETDSVAEKNEGLFMKALKSEVNC